MEMYWDYAMMTSQNGTVKEALELESKMEEEEKILEEGKRLKAWGHNLDAREMALRELAMNLEDREEKAKVMITEVDKRKQHLVEREKKMREKDMLDNPVSKTQRDQNPGTPPVHRGPRPACDGKQGESEVMKPTSHQLFVGNIPHNVEKAELMEFFKQFGRVLEVIIRSGGKLPNFAFVVFDDSEPVQQILGNRPIKFRGNWRLNVEEMKPRSSMNGVLQGSSTHAQKPSCDARQGAGQEELNSAAAASPGSSVEAEKAAKPAKPAKLSSVEEKRLKDWGHNLDEWEMALREVEIILAEKEEIAKAMVMEVEKRNFTVLERENVVREDMLDTPVPKTQRDQRPGTPPVHREPRLVYEGKQGEAQVRIHSDHQLFVGQIPHNVDKAELTEFFGQFGRVLELIIKSGGKLPNFGFVVFDDLKPIQQILSKRPIKFRGNYLNVEVMKTKKLFVGNIPHDVDRAELTEFFEQFGKVLEVNIRSGGKVSNFGFVVFDDSEPVQQILNNRPILFRGNWHLNVEEMKTSRKGVRISGLKQKENIEIQGHLASKLSSLSMADVDATDQIDESSEEH